MQIFLTPFIVFNTDLTKAIVDNKEKMFEIHLVEKSQSAKPLKP